jgi:hypothetical protein
MTLEQITLRQFLREKTDVCEFCVIREDGWIVACAWIDNEDLFAGSIPSRLGEMPVKGDSWGKITILDTTGKKQDAPCHYINV